MTKMENYDPSIKVNVNWTSIISTMEQMMAVMAKMDFTNLKVFPDVPGFNMSVMMEEFSAQFQKMHTTDLTQYVI